MTGEIKVGWDPQATVAPRIDTATVTADPKEPGNNAYLTGTTRFETISQPDAKTE